MTVPRVLLLTGTPPGHQSAAGHFLRDLCLSYPRDSICCFAVVPRNCPPIPQDLNWLPTVYAPRPRDSGTGLFGPRLMHLSAFVFWHYSKLVHISTLVRQAVQFGKGHGVDMVWAILNSPTQIAIAGKVASKLGAKLVTTVWDPPERLSMEMGFDGFSSRNLLHEFKNVIRSSVKTGVASEAMAEEYKKRYGIEAVVLIHGVHPKLMKPPARELISNKQFTIGFVGALYAVDAWQALLSALSKVNWRIEGRNVTIRVLSSAIGFQASNSMHIEYLGWHSLEETIDLMSEVDVTYLPYWFDERYSLSVRLCFPNKLATYLAAGRPVLFHGPEDSSPAHFIRRFSAGLCCHSLHTTEIIECLRKFIIDKEFYANATQAGQQALDQELNLRVFRRRFASLIGIEENDLLPLT